jgi:NitT/TauT family transport system ATP-binding protein
MPVDRDQIIQIRDVSKIYRTKRGGEVVALENITLDMADGEFITVVGPSGCGKSTLLNMLAGLLPASTGHILLRGTPVKGPRKDVGVVFQAPVLLPWHTVLQNTMLPVRVQGLNRAKYTDRAKSLIAMAGLSEFEDKYPFELSGGMQQRASIVRALVHDPAILLMDEPFGALDAMTREQMNVELLRIWNESKKTVVFITHSIPEAVFLADRCVVLCPRPGRLVDVVEVKVPRPRDLSVMNTPEFGEYVLRIRGAFMGDAARPGYSRATSRLM